MVEGRVCVGVGLERVVGEERGWLVRSDWLWSDLRAGDEDRSRN